MDQTPVENTVPVETVEEKKDEPKVEEQADPVENEVTAPVAEVAPETQEFSAEEIRKQEFNCAPCDGRGLKNSWEVCPICQGTGKR